MNFIPKTDLNKIVVGSVERVEVTRGHKRKPRRNANSSTVTKGRVGDPFAGEFIGTI